MRRWNCCCWCISVFFFFVKHKNSLPFVMEIQRSDSIAVTVGQTHFTQHNNKNTLNGYQMTNFYFYWLTYTHIFDNNRIAFLVHSYVRDRAPSRRRQIHSAIIFDFALFLHIIIKMQIKAKREQHREKSTHTHTHKHCDSIGFWVSETCLHSFRLSRFRTHHNCVALLLTVYRWYMTH